MWSPAILLYEGTLPALAIPRLEENLSLTEFADRTEFLNELQVRGLHEQ